MQYFEAQWSYLTADIYMLNTVFNMGNKDPVLLYPDNNARISFSTQIGT